MELRLYTGSTANPRIALRRRSLSVDLCIAQCRDGVLKMQSKKNRNKAGKGVGPLARAFLLGCLLSLGLNQAYANDHPPGSINSVQMALSIARHYLEYTHFKPIGVCFWRESFMGIPFVVTTPEVSEYLPDLVISVFNETGDDPFLEANTTLDKAAYPVANAAVKAATGFSLANGHDSSIRQANHNSSVIEKSVDVIGSPMGLLKIPFVRLRSDTTPYLPYYQSDADVPGKLGVAEAIRIQSYNPMGHYIGKSFLNHWAYEFPRDMQVDNNNDYKASISIALHAADIVTNANTLHVVHSTQDSCGENCAVAGVIEEAKDDHEIWEEVYPHDRHITLGKSDESSLTPIGQKDSKDGHGNYVFVIWRHYKGCVQDPDGSFIWAMVHVPDTKKR